MDSNVGSIRTLQKTPKTHCSTGSTRSHARALSSSSVSSAGSLLPPSALRKGKYDTSYNRSNDTHPVRSSVDFSIIRETFGENASLYNVLRIKPSADNNAIRRAYLREGRKALIDFGLPPKSDRGESTLVTPEAAPKKLEDVPEDARMKFQAISIAHEILSTSDLRRAYDLNLLTGSKHSQIKRATSGNSVRWNPFVEEKIIHDSHPDEHSHRKKSDEGWLQLHLQRLDQEAEMFLNGDFLDELDESIASMSESLQQSIGSLIGKGRGVTYSPTSSTSVSKNRCHTHSSSASMASGPAARAQSAIKQNTLQMICRKTASKSALRDEKPSKVQTQFSKEVLNENGELKEQNCPPVNHNMIQLLESPCSVINVEQIGVFVSEVVDEVASSLAESFSGLLDGPGKKLEMDKNKQVVVPSTVKQIRAMEKKILNEQLRDGFGEPFYSPPSPLRS
ncbi:hypothetical protein ACHAW6_009484 [Cyclotella cf. meneghiniana]